MPKAFVGHICIIQRNAIASWLRLRPRPQIILFGDDEGTAEVAAQWNLEHEPVIAKNQHGTPLMDDMFRKAQERAGHSTLVYINADIVLFDDFSAAVDRATSTVRDGFLLIGRRIDTDVTEPLNFDCDDWAERLRGFAGRRGSLASCVCKDYFVFRKPLFSEIPPFAVGRAVYDNWFVASAKEAGVKVIDVTPVVTAVHQNHNYAHIRGGGRGQAYVIGAEAKENMRLAGGMRLIAGSTPPWVMTRTAVRRRRIPTDLLHFAADLPRFLYLVLELYGWVPGRDRPPPGGGDN